MKYRRWLVAGLVPLVLLLAWSLSGADTPPAAQPDVHFYFAQISDTHINEEDNAQRTAQVIQAINSLPMKIQCVVHTGDILTDAIEDDQVVGQTLDIMGTLKVPVHYVPGNHDIPGAGEGAERAAGAYVKKFAPLCHKAQYEGVVFLFLFTEPLAKGYTLKDYDPLGWLEEQLKESDGKPVIIFHHRPSVDDFHGNTIGGGWPAAAREKWRALLNSYNVKAVIAGHFHRDELHWIGNVPLYAAAPVSGNFGRQNTFRVFEYNNGKIGYWTQYLR